MKNAHWDRSCALCERIDYWQFVNCTVCAYKFQLTDVLTKPLIANWFSILRTKLCVFDWLEKAWQQNIEEEVIIE